MIFLSPTGKLQVYLKLAMTTYIHNLSSWLVILPCSFNLYSSVIY